MNGVVGGGRNRFILHRALQAECGQYCREDSNKKLYYLCYDIFLIHKRCVCCFYGLLFSPVPACFQAGISNHPLAAPVPSPAP